MDYIKQLNCLVVAIPKNKKCFIHECFTRYNTLVYIDKFEAIGLHKRSRYQILSIFNKFLIKIGKPMMLTKELQFPTNTKTKRVQTPHLRRFIYVFQREMMKEELRFYFLEFLKSNFLKQYLHREIKKQSEWVRQQSLVSLFYKWMTVDNFLVMLRYALHKFIYTGSQCYESYAFIGCRASEKYLLIEFEEDD